MSDGLSVRKPDAPKKTVGVEVVTAEEEVEAETVEAVLAVVTVGVATVEGMVAVKAVVVTEAVATAAATVAVAMAQHIQRAQAPGPTPIRPPVQAPQTEQPA